MDSYAVAEVKPASFMLIDAADKWDAIRRLATTTLVVKDGEVIAWARPAVHRLMGEIVGFQRGETAMKKPGSFVEQGSESGERMERG